MGVYATLMTMLGDAPTLAGVSLKFGEEFINAQDQALPYVCVVPVGGPFDEPGYSMGLDPGVEAIWALKEGVDLYLWAAALDGSGQPVADLALHADAIADLRARVLQAFQNQRPYGLYFKPQSQKWELANRAVTRYGRCVVVSMLAEISIPDVDPVNATVQSLTISAAIDT